MAKKVVSAVGTAQLEALLKSLDRTLAKYAQSIDGKPVSAATYRSTRHTLIAALTRIWNLGYHLKSVHQLRTLHINALALDWLRQGYTANTIINNLCRLRQLGRWLGRENLVPVNAAHEWLKVSRERKQTPESSVAG